MLDGARASSEGPHRVLLHLRELPRGSHTRALCEGSSFPGLDFPLAPGPLPQQRHLSRPRAPADQGPAVSGNRGTLHGLRVLDLTGETGFLTGMLLGELGADVIKV